MFYDLSLPVGTGCTLQQQPSGCELSDVVMIRPLFGLKDHGACGFRVPGGQGQWHLLPEIRTFYLYRYPAFVPYLQVTTPGNPQGNFAALPREKRSRAWAVDVGMQCQNDQNLCSLGARKTLVRTDTREYLDGLELGCNS